MILIPTEKKDVGKIAKEVLKVSQDLRDFLTVDERRQMDKLLAKAEARMHEKCVTCK